MKANAKTIGAAIAAQIIANDTKNGTLQKGAKPTPAKPTPAKPTPAKPTPAKPVAAKPAPATIPEASETLFNDLKPSFAADTKHWLIGAKTGAQVFAARIAEPRVIAACLLNKLTALPVTKEGDVDREKLKVVRASFGKLSPDNKAKWEAKALPLFKSALKDYHSATKPLKKAVYDNAQFGLRSLRITLAKSGNIAVTSRHVHTAAR